MKWLINLLTILRKEKTSKGNVVPPPRGKGPRKQTEATEHLCKELKKFRK